jgi:hypothetical protein
MFIPPGLSISAMWNIYIVFPDNSMRMKARNLRQLETALKYEEYIRKAWIDWLGFVTSPKGEKFKSDLLDILVEESEPEIKE